jgi:tRNA(fMet)-specific endonuclease VapC
MSRLLVDTDVFSFVFRDDPIGRAYKPLLDGNSICLSFMTVAELYRWTIVRKWGRAKVNALQQAIGSCVILAPDDETHWLWARNMSVQGRQLPVADAWIAAAALQHQLPLVTHNTADFAHLHDVKTLTAK